jgi:two-component system sensor histidine kinase/response regulator
MPSNRLIRRAFAEQFSKGSMPEQSKTRVLVIDDDEVFRHLVRIHLTQAGYAVETAEDAVEGGKALLSALPDLIICDINMPHMDGMQLRTLLRADARASFIPFVFASSRNDADTMAKAHDQGAADFLHKPATLERLLEAVETGLGKHAGRRSR